VKIKNKNMKIITKEKKLLKTLPWFLIAYLILVFGVITGCSKTISNQTAKRMNGVKSDANSLYDAKFENIYVSTLDAFEVDDWESMKVSLNKKNNIKKSEHGNEIKKYSIELLSVPPMFENNNNSKILKNLENVIITKVNHLSRVDRLIKNKSDATSYKKFKIGIRKNIKTTFKYIQSNESQKKNLILTKFDERIFQEFSNIDKYKIKSDKLESLLLSIQLTTYAAVKVLRDDVDAAYEAIRVAAYFDFNQMKLIGILEKKKQLKIIIPRDKAGKELRKILDLFGDDKYQKVILSSEKWLRDNKKTSLKRLAVINFMVADSYLNLSDDFKKSGYIEKENDFYKKGSSKMMEALEYSDQGFSNGNTLSGVIEYKIISDMISKFHKINDSSIQAVYEKSDAKRGIEFITKWKESYISEHKVSGLNFLKKLLDLQKFELSSSIVKEDMDIEQRGYTKKKIGATRMQESGDLKAAFSNLMKITENSFEKGEQVDSELLEEDLFEIYNGALNSRD
jgi:hypothetical protein